MKKFLLIGVGLICIVEARVSFAALPDLIGDVDAEPPCRDSVVLKVCADAVRAEDLQVLSADDQPDMKLRKEFQREQQAQRFRIEYQNQHPDQTMIWGKTQNDAHAEGVKQFGATVKDGIRPDCMRAYSYAGLLAAPFILHDLLTDTGCH